MEKHELVIIGAGPAGLSAAIYARRAGIGTLVLEKGRPGDTDDQQDRELSRSSRSHRGVPCRGAPGPCPELCAPVHDRFRAEAVLLRR